MIKRDGWKVCSKRSTPNGQLPNVTRICALGQINHQLLSTIATSSHKATISRAAQITQKPYERGNLIMWQLHSYQLWQSKNVVWYTDMHGLGRYHLTANDVNARISNLLCMHNFAVACLLSTRHWNEDPFTVHSLLARLEVVEKGFCIKWGQIKYCGNGKPYKSKNLHAGTGLLQALIMRHLHWFHAHNYNPDFTTLNNQCIK